MSGDDDLHELIEAYEYVAAIHDAAADYLVAKAEREGWHDDTTQAVDQLRHQAATNRELAQKVHDGVGE